MTPEAIALYLAIGLTALNIVLVLVGWMLWWCKLPWVLRFIRPRTPTQQMVDRFAAALIEKLELADAKYGYAESWAADDWDMTCKVALLKHLAKGDPRDVAAYCAFCWHHGWDTELEDLEPLLRLGLKIENRKNAPPRWEVTVENGEVYGYETLLEAVAGAVSHAKESY